MELSELIAYAEEKYNIREQQRHTEFPGLSVLINPRTGKLLAMLMRQWDYDTGFEIQLCDLKCGQQVLFEHPKPYLRKPFFLHGRNWVGILFNAATEADVVFRLFDRAVRFDENNGYTIVIDSAPRKSLVVYPDAPRVFQRPSFEPKNPDLPERLRQMQNLYEYEDYSPEMKCWNFCRQGKFMEDYEDDAPWNGDFHRPFPATYHDLNIKQLRGYFTWRSHIRKGNFQPIATSLAYIYIYELLNGIGAEPGMDALEKMQAFVIGYLDSGIGDQGMRNTIRRWMFQYSVLYDLPPDLARQYADPAILEWDNALATLRTPENVADADLFSALLLLSGKKLGQSSAIKKFDDQVKHLFAACWRRVSRFCRPNGTDFFTACFGEPRSVIWKPLSNAIYWESQKSVNAPYVLENCREYSCSDGRWYEKSFDKLYDQSRFHTFLRETDRILRDRLKTGHYLKRKPGDAWISSFVEKAIQEQQQEDKEATRPKITLDISHLEQIRRDAQVTRDSLLTDEETDAAVESLEVQKANAPVWVGDDQPSSEAVEDTHQALDPTHQQILLALLRRESVALALKTDHLMPSMVADTINRAFLDEIGDNVLECDGDTITLVEDYRDDLLEILGVVNQ